MNMKYVLTLAWILVKLASQEYFFISSSILIESSAYSNIIKNYNSEIDYKECSTISEQILLASIW